MFDRVLDIVRTVRAALRRETGRTRDAQTYEIGGGWGDSVQWRSYETRKVVGWKRRRPYKGDRLKADMQSGRVRVFEFTEVEYQFDPPDMFFGYVRDLGYEDELKEVQDDRS